MNLIVRSTIALSLVLSAGAIAGCDDGNGPKIRRFDASSTSLPAGGDEVTFTWDVTGEESLELLPFPGAVSGSGATVTVTEETTFTLVAKKNGRRDRESLSIAVGEPFTVNGQVLNDAGYPLPGVSVSVGGEVVATAEDGTFVFENVVPPYDLVIFGEAILFGGSFYDVDVFADVTRPDPTLRWTNYGSFTTGNLSGTVSGGSGFPVPAGPPYYQQFVTINSDVASGAGYNLDESGTWNVGVSWHDSMSSVPVDLHFLQYESDMYGYPVDYVGYATTSGVAISEDTVGGFSIVLEDVPESTLGGMATASWTDDLQSSAYLFFPGVEGGYGEVVAFYIPGTVGTDGTYSMVVPDIEGARFAAYLYGDDENGWVETVRDVPNGATSVDLELPLYVIPLAPPAGATVDPTTAFTVSSAPGMVNIFRFDPMNFVFGGGFYNASIRVYTDEESVSFPDLSTLGLPFPSGNSFRWNVRSVGRVGDIDELLERGQWAMPASGDYVASGNDEYRQFWTSSDDDDDDAVTPF